MSHLPKILRVMARTALNAGVQCVEAVATAYWRPRNGLSGDTFCPCHFHNSSVFKLEFFYASETGALQTQIHAHIPGQP